MVRTYKPKNRYCRRTKLSEQSFLAIFFSYMDGDAATEAHHAINKMNSVELSCSRQAIEGVYLKLGKYLWEHFVYPKLEAKYLEYDLKGECPSVGHLIAYYLDMMRQAIEGEIDYSAYREDGIEIGSLETITKLRARSQAFNGLPAKTFHHHFAYVSFISTMEADAAQKGYSMDDVYVMLLQQFEKKPL